MNIVKLFETEPARKEANRKIGMHKEIMDDFPLIDEYIDQMPSDTSSNRDRLLKPAASNDFATSIMNDVIMYLWPFMYESIYDYQNRARTCTPFNLYKKMINSVIGLVTRKDPVLTSTKEKETLPDWLSDIDQNGADVKDFLSSYVFPAAMSGLGCIAASYNSDKQVPYLTVYNALQIDHVKYELIAGEMTLSRCVFKFVKQEETDDFDYEDVKYALVYKLVKEGEEYFAKAELYKEKEETPLEDYEILTRSGKRFNRLPLAFFYGDKVCDGIGQPPLYNAAKKNIKHLNMESSYETGLTVANFPMIYFMSNQNQVGANGEPATPDFKISPKTIWCINDNEAKIGYLEFEGQCLQITQGYIDKLEGEITQQGISMLSEQKTQRTKAQYEGEQMTNTSVLIEIVSGVENAFNTSLAFCSQYEDSEPEVEATLNRDFVIETIDGNVVTSITNLWTERALSGDTLINTLVKLEVLARTTYEEEQKKIQEEQTFSMSEPNAEE